MKNIVSCNAASKVTMLSISSLELLLRASLMSCNSATFKQALHAAPKLVPWAKTSWAFCAPLRDCEDVTFIHKLSCKGSLFVTRISLLT